jgi:hypothetical protein
MAVAHAPTGGWRPSLWTAADDRVYFGTVRREDEDTGEPQAFIVRMPPDHQGLRVHFHPVDQFQVFIAGTARFGRHDVRFGHVHYADALTPYGPLHQGPEGAAFMTLRYQQDFDIEHMPDEAEQLAALRSRSPRGAQERRNLTANLCAPSGAGHWTDALRGDDGLVVATCELATGEALAYPAVTPPGAYLLLVTGSLRCGGPTLRDGSLAWCGAGHAHRLEGVTAGENGARVAVLQFPRVASDLESSRAFHAERETARAASCADS